ncbi:MAG: EMC3/TMCO1 family protein [Nanoarchaeota archaeon]
MKILILVMLLTTGVAILWNNLPIIKNTVHAALDPTIGIFLDWNVAIGMLVVTAIIVLITTLLQKYTTDQQTLKELKEEQKLLSEEMKKFKEHPEKIMELQKKQFELMGKTMPLTMRPLIYTAIPFVLFFRWFSDYFIANPVKVLGMNWFWAYFLASIIFSTIFRKVLKVH